MDLWDLEAAAEADGAALQTAELAALEFVAQAMFSADEARRRVFHGLDDGD